MSPHFIKKIGRCSVNSITQYLRCLFFIYINTNINMCRHSKLEIALDQIDYYGLCVMYLDLNKNNYINKIGMLKRRYFSSEFMINSHFE